LTSFQRRILCADISPVGNDNTNHHYHYGSGGHCDMHVFDLVGTAFLYDLVWHIMAVLLLIGTQLESPSVISVLMDLDECSGSGNTNGKDR
jgi:tRNA pseudouridine38/39 synthase